MDISTSLPPRARLARTHKHISLIESGWSRNCSQGRGRKVRGIGRPFSTNVTASAFSASVVPHSFPRPLLLKSPPSHLKPAADATQIAHLRWLTPQVRAPRYLSTHVTHYACNASQVGSLLGITPSLETHNLLLFIGQFLPYSYAPLSFFLPRPLAPFASFPHLS